MSQVENFLTDKEEQSIVDAIIQAEQNTSGEIRVHRAEGFCAEAAPAADNYLCTRKSSF